MRIGGVSTENPDVLDMEPYLSGKKLWGDDFGLDEIAAWYADEQEGYASLGAKDKQAYKYAYHALNVRHGYRYLPDKKFSSVLGFGSAYGDELLPIIFKIGALTITDPSDSFVSSEVHGVPAKYVKPQLSGELPFRDGSFDLVTCLGVLHHIPNVSFVLGEMARVLEPGGYVVLREPIVSMGDWFSTRPGLTKRERGIPLHILLGIIERDGFEVVNSSLCSFAVTPKIFKYFGVVPYNSPFATSIDILLSRIFSWNLNYHPISLFKKIRPTSIFLVLRKIDP